MYKLTISSETADGLFRDILASDYNDMLDRIRKLESKTSLEPYEQADLDEDRKYAQAMEVMLKYYFAESDWSTIIEDNLNTMD